MIRERADSLLITADSLDIAAGDATEPADLIRFSYRWFSTLEEATHRYPEDPEVAYRFGDALYHSQPPLGGTPAQALEAFDHAITLDPGFAPSIESPDTFAELEEFRLEVGLPVWRYRVNGFFIE